MPAERLHENGELDRAAAAAAVLEGKGQAEPTELRKLGPISGLKPASLSAIFWKVR